ncbi:DNA-directed RNA polymerase subunit beta [Carnobacteriaceae bacterium zg-ZUI252]|nr:DNA-directed RNA polymerase subunit beta [Carnobacteriaceae bacterium zg-ZUI252]MBS4769707.1 DNA-directed RNA polymerase subunit beta [Carnobacteriaceae bacterium zg-ZUI240]QTU83120.1 DNA-directed RNA polymerase subunit beta [Carnobacteriaceae bacterium zg-C25]
MSKEEGSFQVVKSARFTFIENNVLKVLFYIVLILAMALVCFVVGMMIGYSVLGDGNAFDVLDWKTWEYILKFLK